MLEVGTKLYSYIIRKGLRVFCRNPFYYYYYFYQRVYYSIWMFVCYWFLRNVCRNDEMAGWQNYISVSDDWHYIHKSCRGKMKQCYSFNAILYPKGTTSTRKRTSATASSTVAVGTRASNRATWRCTSARQYAFQPTRLKDPTARRCFKTTKSLSSLLLLCRPCPSRPSRLGRWVAGPLPILPIFPIAIFLSSFDCCGFLLREKRLGIALGSWILWDFSLSKEKRGDR